MTHCQESLTLGVVTFCWTPVVLVLRLCHEPELVSSAGDAGAVLELDAFVPVPDHVLVQPPDELVHGHAREVPFVEELLLEPAEEPLRGRVVGAAALRAHGTRQPVLLADADPSGPPVVAASIAVDDRTLAVPERGARLAQCILMLLYIVKGFGVLVWLVRGGDGLDPEGGASFEFG